MERIPSLLNMACIICHRIDLYGHTKKQKWLRRRVEERNPRASSRVFSLILSLPGCGHTMPCATTSTRLCRRVESVEDVLRPSLWNWRRANERRLVKSEVSSSTMTAVRKLESLPGSYATMRVGESAARFMGCTVFYSTMFLGDVEGGWRGRQSRRQRIFRLKRCGGHRVRAGRSGKARTAAAIIYEHRLPNAYASQA